MENEERKVLLPKGSICSRARHDMKNSKIYLFVSIYISKETEIRAERKGKKRKNESKVYEKKRKNFRKSIK